MRYQFGISFISTGQHLADCHTDHMTDILPHLYSSDCIVFPCRTVPFSGSSLLVKNSTEGSQRDSSVVASTYFSCKGSESLTSSTQAGKHTASCDSSSRGSDTTFRPLQVSAHMHIHASPPKFINKSKVKILKPIIPPNIEVQQLCFFICFFDMSPQHSIFLLILN